MICLTGDIHHQGLNTGNQQASDRSEVDLALEAMHMALDRDVRLTYFLTGRLVEASPGACRQMAARSEVEIGGHNYYCYEPKLAHRLWNKLTGEYAGPRWLQALDTQMTVRRIESDLGRSVHSWRNHMYMHGAHIESVLADAGITIYSDGVDKSCGAPRKRPSGLWEMPINVIPDHEHLYHAERTPKWVAAWVQRYGWSDDFGSQSYFVDAWARLVIRQVAENEARGRNSMIIIHPITMYLCDGFAAYRNILSALSKYESVTISELLERCSSRRQEESLCA